MHRTLLTTPLFSVEHRTYARDHQPPVERDVVVHPGAVVVLPLLGDGRVVMIRNYRYTVEQELWELPAGTRESGESPIETAARELEEETGYRAGSVTPLFEFYTSPGVLTERMHAFLATDLLPVQRRPADGERIVVETLPVETIRGMLFSGAIVDGKTIAVLAAWLLRQSPEGLTP